MRIKELITVDELSWGLSKFSQLVLNKCIETGKGNLYNDAGA